MKYRKLNVLHLASFSGNIGDLANHIGFYKKFNKIINYDVEFKQLEIRKFYKNYAEMKFDDLFLELVNQYDLLVLGGGGFFDLRWDYSHTGTTIDFSEQIIEKINTPVLVNAMGYHEFDEINDNNISKFEKFLNSIVNNDKWFISLRNDGSYKRMKNRCGGIVDKLLTVPDHGFFLNPREFQKLGLNCKDRIWIGMSITNDLLSKKFNMDVNSVDTLNNMIGQAINRILDQDRNKGIIFFPHTPQDVITIGVLMSLINEKNKRERVIVAPYMSCVKEAIEATFDLGRVCSCVVSMRFHSNVCFIGMNIPTIGLAGHEQISSLYDELGLTNRCVKINSKKFVDELLDKIDESLSMVGEIKRKYAKINNGLCNQANLYHKKLRDWFLQYIE